MKENIKQIEKTLSDIDKIQQILNENKALYNKDIKAYFKKKKIDNVFKLYKDNHIKLYDNVIEYVKDQPKKALYIQIKHDIYIYIDFDRGLAYCLNDDARSEEMYADIDDCVIMSGDDITMIQPRIKISSDVRNAMMQP